MAKDPLKAEKWWRMAAEQGNLNAQEFLGDLFLGGLGITENYQEAEKWIRKSAEQGHANSQRILGVPQDDTEACVWASAPGYSGYPFAAEMRNEICKKLSREERRVVKKRAKELVEEIRLKVIQQAN